MEEQTIYTIGYGKRTIEDMLKHLQKFGITVLADVRSMPYSKYKPEFSREPLSNVLHSNKIIYSFMGNLLGGHPQNPDCYVNGSVEYSRVKSTEDFQLGINQLILTAENPGRVCIMCSEGRPEECHRSKLIGEVLTALGFSVQHINTEGNLQSQLRC